MRLPGCIAAAKVPVFLVINKIDTIDQTRLEEAVAYWHEQLPTCEIFPVSALERFNVDNLLARIVELLPEGAGLLPRRHPHGQAGTLFRQRNHPPEDPAELQERSALFGRSGDRRVLRRTRLDPHPGHYFRGAGEPTRHFDRTQGGRFEKSRHQAREDIEKFFGKKVFLETVVKVDDGWRSNERKLRKYGYEH